MSNQINYEVFLKRKHCNKMSQHLRSCNIEYSARDDETGLTVFKFSAFKPNIYRVESGLNDITYKRIERDFPI